jgi:hypothetical protein
VAGLAFIGGGTMPLLSRVRTDPSTRLLLNAAIAVGVGSIGIWSAFSPPNPTDSGPAGSTARSMIRVTSTSLPAGSTVSRLLVVLLELSFVLFVLWAARNWARNRRARRE